MSTAHKGGFCKFRDKMILDRSEARAIAKRTGGLKPYHCPVCDGWHISTSKTDGKRFGKFHQKAKAKGSARFRAKRRRLSNS